ncbi:MAG: DUF4198 domain-containing protein [Pyrinomonadaceae bacterium]
MKKQVLLLALAILSLTSLASGHDLFLKLDSFFLQPYSPASVRLLNGTFTRSDGLVARERFRDVSLLADGARRSGAESFSWQDEDKTSLLELQTGAPGTYVVAVSTNAKEIDLKAADFNDYLRHDGIPDTLAERQKNRELSRDVRERYSKHVRAVFQVGDKLTDDYKQPLGYPVEIIPQKNPYALKVGQTLAVLCTRMAKPLVNQFVIAGWESRAGKLHSIAMRTDANGLARFKLKAPAKWYVKLIHMTPLADPKVNYESQWATLTFEIRN